MVHVLYMHIYILEIDIYLICVTCIIDLCLTYNMRFFLHNNNKCINYLGVNLVKDSKTFVKKTAKYIWKILNEAIDHIQNGPAQSHRDGIYLPI